MKEYLGTRCPVCEQRFGEGDDVVVCPDCGTPYHRACYRQAGHCVNQELHEKHEAWSPEDSRRREEERFEGENSRRCGKCGTINPEDGIFCQICGYPLKSGEAAAEGADSQRGPQPIAPNPYTTPYGGISPDETLDGIPVRDLALFVGDNSHYFIPRFCDRHAAGRSAAWNWPAFLFRGLYFLYRKMYLAGAVLLILSLLISAPAMLVNLCVLFRQPAALGLSLTALYRLATIGNGLSLGLAMGCALFANRIYCRHVLGRVKKMRQNCGGQPEQEYVLTLTRRGRTNRVLVAVLLGCSFLFSMALSFLLAMFSV